MKRWSERIKALQTQLGKTPEEMAGTLGITPRTLGEFTRPEGREPSLSIQRVIELLENGLTSGAPKVEKISTRKKLNLVIIHSEYVSPSGGNVVTVIDEMNASNEVDGTDFNNEFHYIVINPERDMQKALPILKNKRVTPHFFMDESALKSSENAECSYFATTATWLASAAKKNNLGRITFAANVQKFWPISKELKELAEVDVSFIREDADTPSQSEVKALESMGIRVFSPAIRYHGQVVSLKDGFGFLKQVKKDPLGNNWIIQEGENVFFSWNHMRKQSNPDIPIISITDLMVGDIVGFAMGFNDVRECATDVTLSSRSKETTVNTDATGFLDVLKEAIKECANEEGWALMSELGNCLRAWYPPDYKEKLRSMGYENLTEPLKKHPHMFTFTQTGEGSNYKAACVRVVN